MPEHALVEQLGSWIERTAAVVQDRVLTLDSMLQAGIILGAFLVSFLVTRPLYSRLWNRFTYSTSNQSGSARFIRTLIRLIPLLGTVVLLRLSILVAAELQADTLLLRSGEVLLGAWIGIRLATSLILGRFWARTVAAMAWTIAALKILGLLSPLIAFLGGIGFSIGEVRLTALSLIKAGFILFVLLRIGLWVGDYLDHRLGKVSDLSPSVRVLLNKIVKISVVFIVVMVSLNSVGIDLTALAVFSGAVGVGIGFGLQKVIANFISGIILLLDKSIKPGDVIQIGDVYGWISSLRGRYASVVTRDGKEYLIPNEDLITQQVINWSFTDMNVRLRIPIGISYKCDPHKARELCLEVARTVKRVLKDPEPACLISGFGDSSVDLELRVWINDPQSGLANVRSEILGGVWDAFKENNIEIPFPQRDVHLDIQKASHALRIEGENRPNDKK